MDLARCSTHCGPTSNLSALPSEWRLYDFLWVHKFFKLPVPGIKPLTGLLVPPTLRGTHVLKNYSAIFCVSFSCEKKFERYEWIFIFTKPQPAFRCSLSWLYVSKAAWHMLQTWRYFSCVSAECFFKAMAESLDKYNRIGVRYLW